MDDRRRKVHTVLNLRVQILDCITVAHAARPLEEPKELQVETSCRWAKLHFLCAERALNAFDVALKCLQFADGGRHAVITLYPSAVAFDVGTDRSEITVGLPQPVGCVRCKHPCCLQSIHKSAGVQRTSTRESAIFTWTQIPRTLKNMKVSCHTAVTDYCSKATCRRSTCTAGCGLYSSKASSSKKHDGAQSDKSSQSIFLCVS